MREYITASGQNLIMKALAGECQIKFTRMVFGDGSIGLSSPRKVSALAHPVTSINVERVESDENGKFFIKARFTNENIKSAFYMREKGVYASDGDNEILFSYGNAGDNANLIPLPSEELIEQWSTLDFTVKQDDDEEKINIELKSGIYVVYDDYATVKKAGLSKPDGTTILGDEDGTLHGFSGSYNDLSDKPTASDFGLGNVDDTSDMNKPVSTAQQTAINTSTSNHNSSGTAHSDIRDLITGLTTRLNAVANSDDTTLDQLSEIVAYIKSNRTLIESVTTSKVNVADIVDNLTSTATNKPLSAKQGKVLNDSCEALKKSVSDGKSSIASAIAAMGVATSSDAAFSTMSDNIQKIKATLSRSANVVKGLINGKNEVTLTVPNSVITKSGSWDGATYTAKFTHTEGYVENASDQQSETIQTIDETITPSNGTLNYPPGRYYIKRLQVSGVSISGSWNGAKYTATANDASISTDLTTQAATTKDPTNAVQTLFTAGSRVYFSGDYKVSAVSISGSWNGATYTATANGASTSTTLTTKAATTITPSKTAQTAVSSGSRLYFSGNLMVDSLGGNAYASDVVNSVTFSSNNAGRAVAGSIIDCRKTNAYFIGSGFAVNIYNNVFACNFIEHISCKQFGLTAVKSTSTAPAPTENTDYNCPDVRGTAGCIHVYRSSWTLDATNYQTVRFSIFGHTNNTTDKFRGYVGLANTSTTPNTTGEGSSGMAVYKQYIFSSTSDTWENTIEIDISGISENKCVQVSVVHGGYLSLRSIAFVPKGV